MSTMLLAQLRQADLNLLVNLYVLLEEQSISRAAKRLNLSQPAMSRALKRLRDLLNDDLLIRTPKGYETTTRAQSMMDDLTTILPEIERLITGWRFDPTRGEASFRICATDNAAQLYAPVLCRNHDKWKAVSISFEPWTDQRFVDLEQNRLDIVLDANIHKLPKHIELEALFADEFLCVVAKDSSLPEQLTLQQYLAADHIGVNVLHGNQTLPEMALSKLGLNRHCVMTVPYFTVAMTIVPETPLMVTVPRRLAQACADHAKMRLIRPPKQLEPFSYGMYWHRRLTTSPKHLWLREMLREMTKAIPPLSGVVDKQESCRRTK